MSENDDHTHAWPLRQGEAWTQADYDQLLHGLFNGSAIEQLADELQRTPGGVRARLRLLVPKDANVPNSTQARMNWLRRRLTENPHWDWRTVVNSQSDGILRLWTETEEQRLKEGWDLRTALPTLARELKVSEPVIAHKLVVLGLASNVAEVEDRLGATPGGTVEARARCLRGEMAEAIYVLVIEHAKRPHISVYHSPKEAEMAVRRFVGASTGNTRWWVLRRTLDGRDAGQCWTAPGPLPATDSLG